MTKKTTKKAVKKPAKSAAKKKNGRPTVPLSESKVSLSISVPLSVREAVDDLVSKGGHQSRADLVLPWIETGLKKVGKAVKK